MNWKRESEEKLQRLVARRASLDRMAEEIKRLDDRLISLRSSGIDSTPVTGGASTREDTLINMISRKTELEKRIQFVQGEVRSTEAALVGLGEQDRYILDRLYVHRMRGNVERLCDELGLEKTAVYNRKDKALEAFSMAMYGGC